MGFTLGVLLATPLLAAVSDDLPDRAAQALRIATRVLVRDVATAGGYPSQVDAAGHRLGRGPLAADEIVVAPDGTAALGLAFAQAWRVTGEPIYRDAALAAARALAAGQLASGGWAETIHTGPSSPSYTRALLRAAQPRGARPDESRLDQGITPAALRLLIEAAELTGDIELREAGEYAVRALLNAQLAGGGWPARLPLPDGDGRFAQTGVTADLVRLFADHPGTGALRRVAAVRGGEWLLLTRGSNGWAPVCNPAQQPVGAPDPALLTPGAVAFLRLHETTSEPRWLEPLAALVPALPAAEADWAGRIRMRLRQPKAVRREPSREERARLTAARAPQVADVVAALDDQGRWLDAGALSVRRLVERLALLTVYLKEYEPLPEWPGPGDGRPPQHRRM